MTTIMDAVAAYEADMIDFMKAGGTEPSDEDQRGQLLKIHNMKTAAELIQWMRSK